MSEPFELKILPSCPLFREPSLPTVPFMVPTDSFCGAYLQLQFRQKTVAEQMTCRRK